MEVRPLQDLVKPLRPPLQIHLAQPQPRQHSRLNPPLRPLQVSVSPLVNPIPILDSDSVNPVLTWLLPELQPQKTETPLVALHSYLDHRPHRLNRLSAPSRAHLHLRLLVLPVVNSLLELQGPRQVGRAPRIGSSAPEGGFSLGMAETPGSPTGGRKIKSLRRSAVTKR